MPTLLETRDLKKHYQMGASTVRALDGVSLTIEEGAQVDGKFSRRAPEAEPKLMLAGGTEAI